MHKFLLRTTMMFACLVLYSCASEPAEQQAEFFVFGTLVEVTTWGVDEPVAEQAFRSIGEQFQRMHNEWHAWEPGLLTEMNRGIAAGLPVMANPDIIEMIRYSQFVEERTEGRFNPAIGALIRLWGFHTSDYPIQGPPPRRSQIDSLVRQEPSSLDIQIDGTTVTALNPAIQLDFGGIAKGYAIDLACDILKSLGINNAIVNAGGDLKALGSHGNRPWRVAVRNPGGGVIGVLETAPDEAVFTSGNYERFRQDNENRYPHIIDPRTGWPVSDVASVTVIAPDGWLADAAATALIVGGIDDWIEVARSLSLSQVLVVDENGTAYLTDQMDARVEFAEGVVKQVVAF